MQIASISYLQDCTSTVYFFQQCKHTDLNIDSSLYCINPIFLFSREKIQGTFFPVQKMGFHSFFLIAVFKFVTFCKYYSQLNRFYYLCSRVAIFNVSIDQYLELHFKSFDKLLFLELIN